MFGKPADFEPAIIVSDATGKPRTIKVAAANSFVAMLEAFARAIEDRGERERQWALAENQARLVGAIADRSPT